jgi:hypothetical protein
MLLTEMGGAIWINQCDWMANGEHGAKRNLTVVLLSFQDKKKFKDASYG